MTGLYVSITPDGKIKRHLSTEHGEVPLEDTTVFGELISLSEKSYLKSVEFAEGLLNQGICFHDQKVYKAFWKKVDSFLTERAVSDPIDFFFTRALITDSIPVLLFSLPQVCSGVSRGGNVHRNGTHGRSGRLDK